jgi:hypothetical protein
MVKRILPKGRVAALIAAFAVAGVVAVYAVATSAAAGRELTGAFCHVNDPFCMSISYGVETFTGYDPGHLTLRPGTYWLTVFDDQPKHDFELRSCPNAGSPCDKASGGAVEGITTVGGVPGSVTVKIHLDHGWYRLYCGAPYMGSQTVTHEDQGMYVDFEVGGVGQVG